MSCRLPVRVIQCHAPDWRVKTAGARTRIDDRRAGPDRNRQRELIRVKRPDALVIL